MIVTVIRREDGPRWTVSRMSHDGFKKKGPLE